MLGTVAAVSLHQMQIQLCISMTLAHVHGKAPALPSCYMHVTGVAPEREFAAVSL
jgi:hypothetical protein